MYGVQRTIFSTLYTTHILQYTLHIVCAARSTPYTLHRALCAACSTQYVHGTQYTAYSVFEVARLHRGRGSVINHGRSLMRASRGLHVANRNFVASTNLTRLRLCRHRTELLGRRCSLACTSCKKWKVKARLAARSLENLGVHYAIRFM